MSAPRALLAAVAAFVFVPVAPAQSLLHSDTTSFLALDDVEITPDQHYAVVRQNNQDESAIVFDLTTGLKVGTVPISAELCGDCVDAVGVTNTRAVVLGGSQALFLDLTQASSGGNLLIASPLVGVFPNDVAVTPNGQFAAVRGGSGPAGGQFIFDMQTGQQLAHAAGDPPLYDYAGTGSYSYDNDSVAVTDQFAVMLSIIGQQSAHPLTRVTIWSLTSAGGPSIVYETGSGTAHADFSGAPHDLAITPDGAHLVVRTEFAILAFQLTGAQPSLLWAVRPYQGPGPFQDAVLDSVEVSNTRVVTISKVTNPLLPQGSQVDFFDFAGNQHFDRMPGRPHDLAVTPDGTRAVVRTSTGVFLYDITTLATLHIAAIGFAVTPSSTAGYQEGLDSVVANDRIAVTLTHSTDLTATDVWFWDIAHGHLELLKTQHIANSRPIDLAITPDSNKVVVTGNSSIDVFHLSTGGLAFEHHPIGQNLYYQWCDGVAASNTKAVGIGQWNPQSGWIDEVDMSPFHQTYCTATVNSTGESASISALGKASVTANSLKLAVEHTPAHTAGRFVYGATQTQIPFGNGVQCVGTPSYGLRELRTNAAGAAFLAVNFDAQTIPPAIITAGSTWNFQFVFSDAAAGGSGTNTSNALSVTFTP